MALNRLNDIALAVALCILAAAIVLIPPLSAKSVEVQPPPTHDASSRTALESNGTDHFAPARETPEPEPENERVAYVTGYNTVPEQTDDTPCIARDGSNICGRDDAAACPRDLALGSWVEIGGKEYECVDRTATKHDGRFDISCDKDMACPHRMTGWRAVRILE